jgi:hypothetical protein
MFSAVCGEERILPGGKRIRPKGTLYVNGLPLYSGSNEDEMAGRLLSVVRDISSGMVDQFIRLRATGLVGRQGTAIVMPSVPEPHLPALAGLMVRAGSSYLGDEVVHVDPVLENVHPIVTPLLIDSDDIATFPELGREPSRGRRVVGVDANTPRRPVAPEELGGHRAGPSPLERLVFPQFRSGETTRLESMPTAEAIFTIANAVLNMHVWGDRALVLADRLVRSRLPERLVIGSIEEAASLLTGGA